MIVAYLHLLQFLERDPSKRLGCKPNGEGFAELQRHPWFQSIDWETLGTKQQTSPFVPDVRFCSSLLLYPYRKVTDV